MLLLFKLFLNICLYRAGPQDVPSSRVLMNLTVLLYFVLSLVITLVDTTFARALIFVATDLAMMISLTLFGLWLRHFINRVQQTITALTGTGIVFNLISWPLYILASHYSAEQLLFPQYLLYLLVFWNIGIIGHILQKALSIPFWTAIIISVLYMFTYYSVVGMLLPPGN